MRIHGFGFTISQNGNFKGDFGCFKHQISGVPHFRPSVPFNKMMWFGHGWRIKRLLDKSCRRCSEELRKLFDFHPCCPYNVNPKITNPKNQIKPLHLESWSYQVLSKPSHNSILGCPHQRKPSRGRLAGAGASRTSSWCTTSSVPRNVSG